MKKLMIVSFIIIILSLSVMVLATRNKMDQQQYGFIVELELEKGWNIVSGLYDVREINADSQIQTEDISYIWYYSPIKKQYFSMHPMDPEFESEVEEDINFYGGDDAILTSAVWVYSKKSGKLKYSTVAYQKLENRRLAKGWNFVGITPDMFKGTISSGNGDEYFLWSEIEGTCNIEKIYFWMYPTQEWDEFSSFKTTKLKSYDFDDFMGNGMLVKVSNNCYLDEHQEEIAQPPSIPN